MKKEPAVDQYIFNASSFAKPILDHLRELVHLACPETEEKIRWGFPHFDHKGMMVSMAAFKKHCAFTFYKGDIMNDPFNVLDKARTESMGQMGKLTSAEDLPSDEIMIGLIREAMRLNDEGIKLPRIAKS